jgi:hypothetical protein
MLRRCGVILAGLIGLVMMIVGIAGVAFGLLAFVDPQATQRADDENPFGVPPSRWVIAMQAVSFAGTGILGAWFVYRATTKV